MTIEAGEDQAGRLERLIAFGISSVVCLTLFREMPDGAPLISSDMVPLRSFAIFLAVASILVGTSRAWFGMLLLAWTSAVALFVWWIERGSEAYEPDPYPWVMSFYFSAIHVTIPFVAWLLVAGGIWLLIADREHGPR